MATTNSLPKFPSGKAVGFTNWGRSAVEAAFRHEDLVDATVMFPAFINQEDFEPLCRRLNITPHFVDIERIGYHIDRELAKDHISSVDAVMVIHPFGLPAKMDAWVDLCHDHDVTLIEDCVRALGAKFNGRVVGSFGSQAIYALHKLSPVSIGGAIATANENPYKHLKPAAYDAHALYHILPDEMQDALTLRYPLDYECRRLDEITQRRFVDFLHEHYEGYIHQNQNRGERLFEALDPLGFQFQPHSKDRAYFLTSATVPEKVNRTKLVNFLHANDQHLPVKIVWPSPWTKTYHATKFSDRYPNTKKVSDNIITFTLRDMDDNDIDFTINKIKNYLDAYI